MSGKSGFSRMEIAGLSAKFLDMEALRLIDLTVSRGEILALVGRNGGGKTTLLRAISGQTPSGGTIRFFDNSGREASSPTVGYVPQRFSADRLSPVTVWDFTAAALASYPVFLPKRKDMRWQVSQCLEKVGIEMLSDRPFCALSGGEMQKLLFALAITPVPELLLLDEPASALDAASSEVLLDTLLKLKTEARTATLLVSHDIPAALRIADRVVLIEETVIFDLPPASAIRHAEFERRFGVLELF